MKIVIIRIFDAHAHQRCKKRLRPGLFVAKANTDIIMRVYYKVIQEACFLCSSCIQNLIQKEPKRPDVYKHLA
jgi:hypothetical protein